MMATRERSKFQKTLKQKILTQNRTFNLTLSKILFIRFYSQKQHKINVDLKGLLCSMSSQLNQHPNHGIFTLRFLYFVKKLFL